MNILLTGFEPFGGEKINPSWEVVKKIKGKMYGANIYPLLLPVAFKKAAEIIKNEMQRLDFDAVLSIGQAGMRSALSIEYIGLNLRHSKQPDEFSNSPYFEKISEEGPDAIVSNLPIEKILKKWEENMIPSYLSLSAGAYVCNDIMYSTALYCKQKNIKSGFVHIPYIKEQVIDSPQNKPFMELDTIKKAIEVAIEEIIKDIEGGRID